MSLDLKFSACVTSGCKQITITDLTGIYNHIDNNGGWGVPNPDRTDVTNSYITVVPPSGISYQVDITSQVQGDEEIIITPDLIGLTTTSCITDGQYYFNWVVETATQTFNEEKYYFFDCIISCKVSGLVANMELETCCNPCSESGNSTIDKAILAWAYLMALKDAACCGKTDKFEKLLATLQRMVDDSQCKSCN